MNGWQRICLVMFAVWVIGISIFSWSEFNIDAQSSAKRAEEICIEKKYATQSTMIIQLATGQKLEIPNGSTPEDIDEIIDHFMQTQASTTLVPEQQFSLARKSRFVLLDEKADPNATNKEGNLTADSKKRISANITTEQNNKPTTDPSLSHSLSETIKKPRFVLRKTNPVPTTVPIENAGINCFDVYKNKIEERWRDNAKDIIKYWWLIPIIVFAPPFFIIVIWVFSYILVKIFYWIKAGFSKADKPREMAKKSSILTISIIFVFVSFFAISAMLEANRKAEFEIALGECKLAEMKAKLPNEDEAYINYIRVCMQTKGYNFVYSNSCKEYFLSEYRCYGN